MTGPSPEATRQEGRQPWQLSWRADPKAVPVADRHYNRQKVGAAQFVPPGRCIVLVTGDRAALWVSSFPQAEYVQHAWAGAVMNSLFRREGGPVRASDLIRAAVAATRAEWEPPPLGMVSFVDPTKVRSANPGYCYRMAGFRLAGRTKGGLLVWQLLPKDWPAPERALALGGQFDLFAGAVS